LQIRHKSATIDLYYPQKLLFYPQIVKYLWIILSRGLEKRIPEAAKGGKEGGLRAVYLPSAIKQDERSGSSLSKET